MNTEIFKDITGYEGLYQVSNLGNVKSLLREMDNGIRKFISKEKILKSLKDSRGYNQVSLYKEGKSKRYLVHAIVAQAFLQHLPNGTHTIVVDHINNIKTDNRVSNLQLITQRENIEKSYLSKKTSSKYTGVFWHKIANKWVAQIRIEGKKKYLGCFADEYKAHLAYQNALNELNNKNIQEDCLQLESFIEIEEI